MILQFVALEIPKEWLGLTTTDAMGSTDAFNFEIEPPRNLTGDTGSNHIY